MLSPAIFPGRVLLVLGVRPRRGGGRGAGPGFMNWSREYMLLCGHQQSAGQMKAAAGLWQGSATVGGRGLDAIRGGCFERWEEKLADKYSHDEWSFTE
jgi:hypothetical protein